MEQGRRALPGTDLLRGRLERELEERAASSPTGASARRPDTLAIASSPAFRTGAIGALRRRLPRRGQDATLGRRGRRGLRVRPGTLQHERYPDRRGGTRATPGEPAHAHKPEYQLPDRG